jgi:hypothetical protein
MDTEKSKQQPEEPQQSQQQQQQGNGTTGKSPDDIQDEFINTGRIGRRNALPDILDSHCETSTADLPMKLSALTTNGEFLFCTWRQCEILHSSMKLSARGVFRNTIKNSLSPPKLHVLSDSASSSSSSSNCQTSSNQTNNK